ncbi:MAG: pilus assembly protein PilM [Candidatus Sumerlaeia bacterium]|nr:pilus assembly protein PilM [Candidatus Sumerlaeia bacterium]
MQAAALELTDADLKVCILSWSKKAPIVLERAFTVDFTGLPKDAAGNAERARRVREKVRVEEQLPPCDVALLLPKQYCVARNVRLPSNDLAEIAGMVSFEADKHIPFNRENHIVGWELVAKHGLEGSDVLLAAVEEQAVQPAVDISRDAGFEPLFASVSSVSLAQSFIAIHPAEAAGDPVVLLHIGPIHSEITIVHKGRIVATRAILHGLQTLRMEMSDPALAEGGGATSSMSSVSISKVAMQMVFEAAISMEELLTLDVSEPDAFRVDGLRVQEDDGTTHTVTGVGKTVRNWLLKLVTQVRRTYDYARRDEPLPAIRRVYLSGEGSLMRGMADSLQVNLGVEVVPFNPMGELPISAKIPPIERERLPAYASLFGAIRRLQEILEEEKNVPQRINLLPHAVVASQAAQERKVLWTITGTLALIAAIMVFLVVDTNSRYHKALGRALTASISEMEPRVRELREMDRKVRIIKRLRDDRASAMLILDKLSSYPQMGSVLVEGRVTVTDYKFVADRELTISGSALAISDVNNLVAYLRDLKVDGGQMLEGVRASDQQPERLSGRTEDIYRFTITANLRREDRRR